MRKLLLQSASKKEQEIATNIRVELRHNQEFVALEEEKKEEVKIEPACACNGEVATYEASSCCCGGQQIEKENKKTRTKTKKVKPKKGWL